MPKAIHSTPKVCHYEYNMAKQWYVHFRANHPSTGVRKQFRFFEGINYFHTKSERIAEANALCRVLKEKLAQGWCPFGVEKTVYDTLEGALKHITSLKWEPLRYRTKYTYNVIITIFYEWANVTAYGFLRPVDFGYNEAQEYMDYLSIKKSMKGRTWNNHLSFMKIFFNYLVDRDIIPTNPFKRIKKHVQATSTRNTAFTENEFVRLNKYLLQHSPRLYYFNMFIYYGALRQKEISMLRIKDIDFVNQNIFISSDISKNKKSESVVITENFMKIIREMKLEGLPSEYYIFSFGCAPGPTYNNTFDKLSVKTKRAIRLLKINEACTQYSYKHTGVIRLYYATGHNIHAVSQHCRHYSVVVTQHYMKSLGFIDNKAVREAIF